jgi:dienelactone hydrolase
MDMGLDPQAYRAARAAEAAQEMVWRKQSMDKMRAWQNTLRARLRITIGLPREGAHPLQPRVTETREFPQYRRETVIFQSRPGVEVFAYFLAPKDLKPGAPAVLCLPGHGTGVDSIVGIRPDGTMRPWGEWGDYQKDFALQCVANGYAALAIEQISFGHRRDAQAQKQGGGASSCIRDSMAALMLGETITGWRVWDAMKGLDYLATRPEVDPRRLATMGISGGGLTSLFTAALDTRVKAAVVSGYFNTFRDSILAVDHCPDNYVPGLLKLVEMPDLAGLVAKRALFTESGAKDPIFPLPAFHHAVERAKEIYAAFGAPDHFGAEVFEADHQFHGAGAFRFLVKRL